ncbi:hypothetical protein [uncultured Arcobacter sp.]|uniref:hypothetical protein n=1 Tax=uncultured Arcobacter sp. TaxID=165434 RepID=UPI002606C42A|nr:hypothetical protein [uncultured Arcobacter sp.]
MRLKLNTEKDPFDNPNVYSAKIIDKTFFAFFPVTIVEYWDNTKSETRWFEKVTVRYELEKRWYDGKYVYTAMKFID